MNNTTTQARLLRKVRGHGRGHVFTPSDFRGLASDDAIAQALSRLTRDERIRRLGRGIYDLPRRHALIGSRAPDPDAIARAIARRDGSRVDISGAAAANLLGLSTQVAARPVYMTTGRSRQVVAGPYTVKLERARAPDTLGFGTPAGTFIRALNFMGAGVEEDSVLRAARRLSDADRARLAALKSSAPAWMRPFLDKVSRVGV